MKDISRLSERLNGRGLPIVIDGGMGSELEKSGVPMDGKTWSGRAVLSHPGVVRAVHTAYINAGAEVIIANTFATARHMLEPAGLGHKVGALNLDAVELAKQARDHAAKGPVAIAGSICEWAPSEDIHWKTPEAIGRSAKEQAEYLAEAGVDLIALEMCMEPEYSIAVTEAALSVGLPVWIGVSAKTHTDEQTLSVFDYKDIEFELLVEALAEYPAMMMNIMHTPVTDVDAALSVVQKHWSGPVGVYPESGFFKMPSWHFINIIDPQDLATHVSRWARKGVRLFGGCCGLGPAHISAIKQQLENQVQSGDVNL